MVLWYRVGIMLNLFLILTIVAKSNEAENKKQQEAYWEQVKKTPLIQWACDADGYQLYLGERPEYVYQCSTGKLIATLYHDGYMCKPSYKTVNHWKHCEHTNQAKNSKYNHLLK